MGLVGSPCGSGRISTWALVRLVVSGMGVSQVCSDGGVPRWLCHGRNECPGGFPGFGGISVWALVGVGKVVTIGLSRHSGSSLWWISSEWVRLSQASHLGKHWWLWPLIDLVGIVGGVISTTEFFMCACAWICITAASDLIRVVGGCVGHCE